MDIRDLLNKLDTISTEAKAEKVREPYTVDKAVKDIQGVVFAEPSKGDIKYSSANIKKFTDSKSEIAYKVRELASRIKNNDELSLYLADLAGRITDPSPRQDEKDPITNKHVALIKQALVKHNEMDKPVDPDSQVPFDDNGDEDEFESADVQEGPIANNVARAAKIGATRAAQLGKDTVTGIRRMAGRLGQTDQINKMVQGLNKLGTGSVSGIGAKGLETFVEPLKKILSNPTLSAAFMQLVKKAEAMEKNQSQVGPLGAEKNSEQVEETWFQDMIDVTFHGDEFYENFGWVGYDEEGISEGEYQGRTVQLNKPMRGDVKKFKVYVKNPKGNVVKVNFGDPDMKIKAYNPERRRSFRARHNCDNPGPKTKARYWSCRKW
jgi:cell fate (sporulation/competence/biofilm development) regulator YmcA (YheA/YmcA/DUF963 family)